eukprot:gene20624-22659_t
MAETSTSRSKKTDKSSNKERGFVWTDEETALLLQIIIDYKASKTALGLDWETIKSKYEEILELFHTRYPKEGADFSKEQYRHISDPTVITKDKIVSKIKRIRTMFRKAVDSGRKSGGGRVIFALYDECEEIWAGSPAVNSMNDGIESSFSNESSSPETTDMEGSIDSLQSTQVEETGIETKDAEKPVKDMALARRNLLAHLKEKKDSKLSKRTSGDAQLLDIAREELKLKKATLASIESSKEKHAATMDMFGENFKDLTKVISNGFGMLQQVLSNVNSNPPPNMFIQHPSPYPMHQNSWGPQYQQSQSCEYQEPLASFEKRRSQQQNTFMQDNICNN